MCKVCYNTLIGYVFQCTNGHIFCISCLDELQEKNWDCPYCQCDLSEPNRCRLAENILQSVPLPCEYDCGFDGVESARTKHVKEGCPNSPVGCPNNCIWQGGMKELKQHMIDTHKYNFWLRENGESRTLTIDREGNPKSFWHCVVDGVALSIFEHISDHTISWFCCAIDNKPRGTVTFRSNANDKRSTEITIPIISFRKYTTLWSQTNLGNRVDLSFFANNKVVVCYNIY